MPRCVEADATSRLVSSPFSAPLLCHPPPRNGVAFHCGTGQTRRVGVVLHDEDTRGRPTGPGRARRPPAMRSDDDEDEDEDGMLMSDQEEYDFEYEDASDEEGEDDDMVKLENSYYTAKGTLEDDSREALRLFGQVVEAEKEKGDWCVEPNPRPRVSTAIAGGTMASLPMCERARTPPVAHRCGVGDTVDWPGASKRGSK